MMTGSLFILFHKIIDLELAFKLTSKEFKCQCTRTTCSIVVMSPALRDSWNISRAQFAKPLKVNSGHRCGPHNEEVGGIVNSKHLTGEAIDISHDEFQNYFLI